MLVPVGSPTWTTSLKKNKTRNKPSLVDVRLKNKLITSRRAQFRVYIYRYPVGSSAFSERRLVRIYHNSSKSSSESVNNFLSFNSKSANKE